MSIRDAYYFALLEVHNGRPISVKTCFKGQQGDLTTLSRTVCRCQKQPDGSLRPEYGFDDEENANCFIDPPTILLWLSPAATGTMPTACGHCSSSGSLPISA